MERQALRADLLLLGAAVLWGTAFVAQRSAMQHIGPLTYNGVRFAIGGLALLPFVVIRARIAARRGTRRDRPKLRTYLVGGTAAGLVLLVAADLQQAGLVYTTAGKAGFITGLYAPLVPLLGLLGGQRTRRATWAGVGLAVVGLYFLSVSATFELNPGDALILACAAACAVQVLVIAWLAPRLDPLVLGLIQCSIVAGGSLLLAGCAEHVTLAGLRAAAWEIAYGGVCSVSIAFTLQIIGQRHAPPGHAALVMSLEAVFAALAGYLVLHETFGPREMLGAALMLSGTLVSQVRRLTRAPT
jgi:drug/metabolite transporter (DMT)-like permease